jgi:hypothetical protein
LIDNGAKTASSAILNILIEPWVASDVSSHAILVTGQPGEKLDREDLKIALESKRNNGGPTKEITLRDDDTVAVAVFQDSNGEYCSPISSVSI